MTRVIVIGGGMAGIATAAEIATDFDVVVLEQEFQTGYHSTGRSAAVLHLAFENDVVHRLSLLSESFYLKPPPGFGNLSTPLSHIAFDSIEHQGTIRHFLDGWLDRCPWLKPLQESDIRRLAPLLNTEQVCGSLDERSLKLDVDAILQGFTRRLKERGGEIHTTCRVRAIDRTDSGWQVEVESGTVYEADLLVNATGAWVDRVAELSGLRPLNIQPKRRTGVLVDPGQDLSSHPMCYKASGGLYFKSEGSLLMLSPADAIDSAPTDAQPDELDVALTIDLFNRCTNLEIERPFSTWAGLRSFAPDDLPVVGYDQVDPQFFWVAGLGGFGIQTAPAYSRIAADILCGRTGQELEMVSQNELSPSRFFT